MEFRFTPEQEAFRARVRAFIAAELPANWAEISMRGGEPAYAVTRQFHRALAANKWLALAWPPELGGTGADIITQLIYHEEMHLAAAPAFTMGVAWVGPAITMYASDEQRARYLPRIASGEDVYCTLYSEPGAGSDLAAMTTRAVRDGDEFVISGRKVWTTWAHKANLGWLAARTGHGTEKNGAPTAGVSRSKGISTFIIAMDTPGITVRPIINMAGQHDFNEVIFDDARIPASSLIGELNTGWRNISAALELERSGIEWVASARRALDHVIGYVRDNPQVSADNPQLRYELAQRVIEAEAGRLLCYRTALLHAQGKSPTYESSASKVYNSELTQRVAQTGMKAYGLYGNSVPGNPYAPFEGQLTHAVMAGYLWGVANTIGAGSSEIQRTIIATRGLGLPR
jgi:alkylation response protein AidB-like acyl-CoA dehydrogenase